MLFYLYGVCLEEVGVWSRVDVLLWAGALKLVWISLFSQNIIFNSIFERERDSNSRCGVRELPDRHFVEASRACSLE